jgi:phosphoglycolate phosphatase-like HAD superfamily hydrolase
MKPNRLFTAIATILIICSGCTHSSVKNNIASSDPLNLWNEGPAKTSILTFIKTVTDENNPDFIPVQARVAVFDMDGTILLEKPSFALFDFVAGKILEQIARQPALKHQQPYKAFYDQDWAYLDTLHLYGDDGLYSILLYAAEGYTDDQYRKAVLEYCSTVKDKRYNKPFIQLVYAPVVQLIQYLQGHQFEVYIVSGSDSQFIRAFCEEAIHIPDQNVIGTTVLTRWVETGTGSYFVRQHKFVEPINDEGGKPVNILNKIGKVPVLAVGNSPGDYHMLQYSKNAPHSLQMIVNHDDPVREYDYDAAKMKKLCQANGWQIISMKNDFKVIFNK